MSDKDLVFRFIDDPVGDSSGLLSLASATGVKGVDLGQLCGEEEACRTCADDEDVNGGRGHDVGVVLGKTETGSSAGGLVVYISLEAALGKTERGHTERISRRLLDPHKRYAQSIDRYRRPVAR